MTEQTIDTTVSTQVDAAVTDAAQTEAKKAKEKKTVAVSKAELTVEYLKSKLELRTQVFLLVGDQYVELLEGAEPIEVTLKDGSTQMVTLATAEQIDGLDLVKYQNFFHLADGPTTRKGDFAGTRRPTDGYYSVVLNGVNYSGKQLAWFYENGNWDMPKVSRATGEAKPKKEAKPHQDRGFAPLSPAAVAAAKAAAKAAKEAKAAKKAAEAPKESKPAVEPTAGLLAAAPAAETAPVSTDSADTADIGGEELL